MVGRPLICQPKKKLVREGWSRLKKGEGGGRVRWSNGRREAFRILRQNEEDIEKGHKGMGPMFLKDTASSYSTCRVQLVLQRTAK